MLDFNFARCKAARPQDELIGNADQIGGGEFGAGRLVAIVEAIGLAMNLTTRKAVRFSDDVIAAAPRLSAAGA